MKNLSAFRRTVAQRLRQNLTPHEIMLWRHLKRIPVCGTHFRKQVPIGPYVADFACLSAKLVIEADGSQHSLSSGLRHDETRTRWMKNQGYTVLRFWNNQIAENLESVLETIQAHLKHFSETDLTPPRHAPHADPPPQGEGEESSYA